MQGYDVPEVFFTNCEIQDPSDSGSGPTANENFLLAIIYHLNEQK